MKLALLCLVFVIGAVVGDNHNILACTRDEIITCFYTYVDLDGNHLINSTEIDVFLTNNPCGATELPSISGTTVVTKCDQNNDAFLSAVDYFYDQGCGKIRRFMHVVCDICKVCNGGKKKK